MSAAWTVRDGNGELLADFVGASHLEVGRRIVPGRYDAFRLHVSSSYRAMFDRAVAQVLERQGWQIVRIKSSARPRRTHTETLCAHAA
jgi:hypothetical protein